ncbi:hypothetical protein [Oceanirhabdus sp. W0125-5]|uniref:hypothetical protein n=1 Tax=Oceanirhabdus sp. W0125-5 TaxID=2999116 RepID=UPI0022F2FE32|nr:hypothetical protein [Oceanirhabdus sp. W0125-5]WBW98268.1 hypothetical protein OW730_05730 [Oceanirhabdus sp. W0125-5]
MDNYPINNESKLGQDIVESAKRFEESLAKFLEAEAEKVRALTRAFDSNLDTTTKYDLNEMNAIFKDTLDSIHLIKKSILENMVFGSTLMSSNNTEKHIPKDFKEEITVSKPKTNDYEKDDYNKKTHQVEENIINDDEPPHNNFNIENLFSSENYSEAKELFAHLTGGVDLDSLDLDSINMQDITKILDMFGIDNK